MRFCLSWSLGLWLAAPLAWASTAQLAQEHAGSLAELSLEELGNIQIVSVSKRAQRLSDAAASVFVITADDIRRSGANSLPEVLRLAPNLQVGQVHAPGYAISARGFNNNAANKLLVLIDGRSVYTPLFAGVFWDVQDLVLEDIERIEVSSGPGGTLWGTNAVNGVINIITRSAKSTQGTLVSAGAGSRESGISLRHGAGMDSDGGWRVYAKYTDKEASETANRTAKQDASYRTQLGFRADWGNPSGRWMVQGNAYSGKEGQPLPGAISISGVKLALDTISLSGANLTARWERLAEDGSGLTLQAYFDRTQRTVPPTFAEALDIYDLQFQHSLALTADNMLSWGGELRQSRDRLTNSQYFGFLPANVDQRWSSIYLQDDITLRQDLRLTLGLRLERNDYTGSETLPNARLAWKPAPEHLLWAAASGAVRAPSRLDVDSYVPGQPPFLLAGGAAVVSEVARVFELGYRGQPARALSYSATLFRADYDHLRTQEVDPSRRFLTFASLMEGRVQGLEMWGTLQLQPRWRLSGGVTLLSEDLRLKPGSNDLSAPAAQQGRDPRQHWVLRSSLDLGDSHELDCMLRRYSTLDTPLVPAYFALDLRYGWKPRKGLELSVVAQNLGAPHGEFTDVATRTQLASSLFFKAVTQF